MDELLRCGAQLPAGGGAVHSVQSFEDGPRDATGQHFDLVVLQDTRRDQRLELALTLFA